MEERLQWEMEAEMEERLQWEMEAKMERGKPPLFIHFRFEIELSGGRQLSESGRESIRVTALGCRRCSIGRSIIRDPGAVT
jgi:hypothetical protein